MNTFGLAKRFQPLSEYAPPADVRYRFLPFRFHRMQDGRVLVTNEVGEFAVLTRDAFANFLDFSLHPSSPDYQTLKSKHILLDGDSTVAIDLLALKVRTKYRQLRNFTSLHIFVVTLRCDYSCPYCQVSRQTEDKLRFDMTKEIALKGIEFAFRSPSRAIKMEFQGGEPLLNFELVRFIVDEAKARNKLEGRDLQFVIATNLSKVDAEILSFCEKHEIYISTSLDGPQVLHDSNRPRPGRNGHALTVSAIEKSRAFLGRDRVAALMTTTEESLSRVRDIIDEYLAQGFSSIFLRALSPYGFAIRTKQLDSYSTENWLAFYKDGLDYILELNRRGIPFREEYAAIILTKMLTPYGHGFVDLQSPSGAGISAVVFNYDGDVYASDEARMLAEMGDKTFRLGSLLTDDYKDVIGNETLLKCLDETLTDGVPMCRDCAFKSYCGSDPLYHHATQGDWVGHKAKSGFCSKNMAVFEHLIRLLEDGDRQTRDILNSWARA